MNLSIEKATNYHKILRIFQKYGSLTTDQCVQKAKLSRPTVLKILQRLKGDHILAGNGFQESTIGRSAQLFDIDDKTLLSIGVILFFPTISVVVGNLRGKIAFSTYSAFDENISCNDLLELMQRKVDEAKNYIETAGATLIGIAVGLPGNIDIEHGISIDIERVKIWKNVPICDLLQQRYKAPVLLKNDVSLISMVNVEKYLIQGKNMLYIRIHSGGIGSAYYYHGKLVDGKNGNCGNFGHIVIDPNGKQCFCGNHGCLEGTSSFGNMLRAYQECNPEANAKDFSDLIIRVKNQDRLALKIVHEGGFNMGMAIANTVKICDINLVVISLPKRFMISEYIDSIREGYDQCILKSIKDVAMFQIEFMDEKDTAIGAAKYVANTLIFNN